MSSDRSISTPGWLIDELSYAGRENLDAGHVARYDVKEDASATSEVALLKGRGLTRDSLVLEFGAGTGQFSVAAARECARVIAVDVSDLMLERLQSKVTDLKLSNVEIVRAGFLTYEHVGVPADDRAKRLRNSPGRALRGRNLREVSAWRRLTGPAVLGSESEIAEAISNRLNRMVFEPRRGASLIPTTRLPRES